jgi:hypothetical protein
VNEDNDQQVEYEIQLRNDSSGWDWYREVGSRKIGERIVEHDPNLRLVQRTVILTGEALA